MDTQDTGTVPSPMRDDSKTYLIALSVLVGILLVFGGFMMSTQANADYICTRIIEDTGSCTNGAWGEWATVASDTDAETGDTTLVEERTYTGTRVIRHVIEYLNRRTSCNAGYSQAYYANTGGASGFHGGNIVTESQVCQIQEQRTTYVDGDTQQSTLGELVTTDNPTGAGDTVSDTISVDSLEAINEFRRAQADLGLSVQPALIAVGQSAEVRWTTVEMVACRVTADSNDDQWGAVDLDQQDLSSIAGVESSSPITQATTYTLDCIDFEGAPHQETATVRPIPQWEEF